MKQTTVLNSVMTGLLVGALLLFGCKKSGGPQSKGTIALSVLTMTNPFFKEIADSMRAEAAKHGYDVIVTSGEFDVAKQQDQVKDFIVKKVRAIVLTPCDSKSIGPAIKEANEAGIPVFTADIACTAPDVKVESHIATDNFGGGKLAAVAIVEALKKRGDAKGEIAIIDHPEVESVIMRTKGFKEQLAIENAKADVDLKIVKQLPGGGAEEQSLKTMQDILQSNKDVKGVFAINDPSALGAVAHLEAAGKLDQVVVIGFDGMPRGKKAIKDGKIYADPIQFPDKIGRMTVQAIMKHFRGEPLEKEILIDTALYRREDAMKDPSVK
jgi:ribose transport system substrate-binding protein